MKLNIFFITTFFLISLQGFALTVAPKDSSFTKQGHPIDLLDERLRNIESLKPEDYLLDFKNMTLDGGTDTFQEEYVFGGNSFFADATSKQNLLNAITNFNTLYGSNVKLFVVVGRTYIALHGQKSIDKLELEEEKNKKILNALANKLQQDSPTTPNRFKEDWRQITNSKLNVISNANTKAIILLYQEGIWADNKINRAEIDGDAINQQQGKASALYRNRYLTLVPVGLTDEELLKIKQQSLLDKLRDNLSSAFTSNTGLSDGTKIKDCVTDITTQWGKVLTLDKLEVLVEYVNGLSSSSLPLISWTKRQEYLDEILKAKYSTCSGTVTNPGQIPNVYYIDDSSPDNSVLGCVTTSALRQTVNNLLNASSNQADQILAYLEANGSHIGATKKRFLHFLGFQNINEDQIAYKTFVDMIGYLVKVSSTQKATHYTLPILNKNKIIFYDDGFGTGDFAGKRKYSVSFNESDFSIKYSYTITEPYVCNVPSGGVGTITTYEKSTCLKDSNPISSETLHPFDIIMTIDDFSQTQPKDAVFSKSSKISQIEEATLNQHINAVPAFTLQYYKELQRKNSKDRIINGLVTTSEIGLTLLGGGELIVALRAVQYYTAVTELCFAASGAAEIVKNTIPDDGTEATKNTKKALEKFQSITNLGGFLGLARGAVSGSISSFMPKLDDELLKAGDNISLNRIDAEEFRGYVAVIEKDANNLTDIQKQRYRELKKIDAVLEARGIQKAEVLIEESAFATYLKADTKGLTVTGGKVKKGTDIIAELADSRLKLNDNFISLGSVEEAAFTGGIREIEYQGIVYSVEEFRAFYNTTTNKLVCDGLSTFCFTPNTPLTDGIAIEDKQVGGFVEAYQPSTQQKVWAKIKNIRRSLTQKLTTLLIAGTTLNVTPAHALQTEAGAWVPASQLHAGDHLRTPEGIVEIQDVCTEELASPTMVMSLELEDDLPYYVGQMPVMAAPRCALTKIAQKKNGVLGPDYGAVAQILSKQKRLDDFLDKLKNVNTLTSTQFDNLFAKLKTYDEATLTTFADDFIGYELEFAQKIIQDPTKFAQWERLGNVWEFRNNSNLLVRPLPEKTLMSKSMRDKYVRDLLIADNAQVTVMSTMINLREELKAIFTQAGVSWGTVNAKNFQTCTITRNGVDLINGSSTPFEYVVLSQFSVASPLSLGNNRRVLSLSEIPPETDRYFKASIPKNVNDSEVIAIEFAIEQRRIQKGINIPAGKTREDILPQILAGENLQINITSEMSSCESCAGIIEELKKASKAIGSPTRANVSYGVRYK